MPCDCPEVPTEMRTSGRFEGWARTVRLSRLLVRGLPASADHEIDVSLPARFAVLVGANSAGTRVAQATNRCFLPLMITLPWYLLSARLGPIYEAAG